jgi:hypothetical protein
MGSGLADCSRSCARMAYGSSQPVHNRHVNVHENKVKLLACEGVRTLLAILGKGQFIRGGYGDCPPAENGFPPNRR